MNNPRLHLPPLACSLLLWLLFSCYAITPTRGQARNHTRFLRWAYQDAGALVHHFGVRTPIVASGSAIALAAASRLDPPLLEEVQEGYSGPLATGLNLSNELGSPHMTPIMAGIFAVSLVTHDERFQDAAFTSFQALVYAGFITLTLKETFGRYRPEAGRGAYRFEPFSGNTSFPSGHTTAAFALITPWVLYYPNIATYSLFAISAGTGVARIARDKHWPTDVVVGATIGFFTARYLSHRHQRKTNDAWLNVTLLGSPGTAGLSLNVSLD